MQYLYIVINAYSLMKVFVVLNSFIRLEPYNTTIAVSLDLDLTITKKMMNHTILVQIGMILALKDGHCYQKNICLPNWISKL